MQHSPPRVISALNTRDPRLSGSFAGISILEGDPCGNRSTEMKHQMPTDTTSTVHSHLSALDSLRSANMLSVPDDIRSSNTTMEEVTQFREPGHASSGADTQMQTAQLPFPWQADGTIENTIFDKNPPSPPSSSGPGLPKRIIAIESLEDLTTDSSQRRPHRSDPTCTNRQSVTKTVYLIRHGEASHNVAESAAQKKAKRLSEGFGLSVEQVNERMAQARRTVLDNDFYHDALMSERGERQAMELQTHMESLCQSGLPKPQAVVASPLRRTLQTMELAFPGEDVDKITADRVIEKRTGRPCDDLSPPEVIRELSPRVSMLDSAQDSDLPAIESDADVQVRARRFLHWIRDQPYDVVAVVTHKAFLRNLELALLANWEHVECDPSEFSNAEVRVLTLVFK